LRNVSCPIRPSAYADGTMVQVMWTTKDEGSGYERIGKVIRDMADRERREDIEGSVEKSTNKAAKVKIYKNMFCVV
jgi:hypothetical protein